MDSQLSEQFSTLHVGHLGLVVDKIESLGLIERIDQRLPVSEIHGAKVTHGERIAAMILNGLGFIDNRLYLFPEFLRDKPVDRLFNKPLEACWFNDDALGRCLDEISSYGCTKLFTELSLHIGQTRGLLGRSMHLDTTTLSLYGDYEIAESEDHPVPKKGYAKSGRHDLKQMILLLATTGAAHFPVWMEAHSGNASDQKTLPAAAVKMKQLCEGLRGSQEFIYVGDSAIYSNMLPHSSEMTWITRIPESIKEAKEWVLTPAEALNWIELGAHYQVSPLSSCYGGVDQRWLLVFSQAAFDREIKTFSRRIEKESKIQARSWRQLSGRIFTCEADALSEIEAHRRRLKYHQVAATVVEIRQHMKAGRPKKGEKAELKGYRIDYNLSLDDARIEQLRTTKGRFILATNAMDPTILSDEQILREYKAQSGVEKSFKFIKNNTFEVDSVFLKTPARIEALMMVMTLCLMIYGLSEYELHQSLQSHSETLPNQLRKETQRPSLSWIYTLFRVVNELHINRGQGRTKIIVNVDGLLKRILKHFGQHARRIYLNSG